MNAFVYILRCADNSYYVGSARGTSLDKRIDEHQAGTYPGYTRHRRPVTPVYAEMFERITDAIAMERCVKGWSRAKKEALIQSDWDRLKRLAKRSHLQDETSSIMIDEHAPTPMLEAASRSTPMAS